jgi:hypothetical protein
LQARQAAGDKALTPAADGVAVAAKLAGDVLVGRVARLRRGQDDAAAEGQRLRGGAGPEQGFEPVADIILQFDNRAEGARHGRPPGRFDQLVPLLVIMATAVPHGYTTGYGFLKRSSSP